MISKNINKIVRKGDLTKIENYDKAIADKTQTWICHHRLELTLDGEFARSKEDLERMGMYYNRPYFELIFVTRADHVRLHHPRKGKTNSEEHRKKISEAREGKHLSEEQKKKMSEKMKGRVRSEEHRKHLSEALKGKHLSEETKQKISKTLSRYKPNTKSDFGKKYFEHYGYSRHENTNQYNRENRWYVTHNHKCSWEV